MNKTLDTRAFCPHCRKNVTSNEMSYLLYGYTKVWCTCGKYYTLENVRLTLSPEGDARATPALTKSFKWYHGTRVTDWYDKVVNADVHVHVGELEASWDILISDFQNEVVLPESYFLWTLEFNEDACLLPGLFGDEDDDSVFREGVGSVYMNRWESPGSVSVFTPARFLTPVSFQVVTVDEVANHESLYSCIVTPNL